MRDLSGRETQDLLTTEAAAQFYDQVKKWIGGFAATLCGLITLTFAGGIGANVLLIRACICEGFSFTGIKLNQSRNAGTAELISSDASQVKICVIRTNEELIIPRSVWCEGRTVLEKTVPPRAELVIEGDTT